MQGRLYLSKYGIKEYLSNLLITDNEQSMQTGCSLQLVENTMFNTSEEQCNIIFYLIYSHFLECCLKDLKVLNIFMFQISSELDPLYDDTTYKTNMQLLTM